MPPTSKHRHDHPSRIHPEMPGRQAKPQKTSHRQSTARNFQNETSLSKIQNVQELAEGMAQKCEVRLDEVENERNFQDDLPAHPHGSV